MVVRFQKGKKKKHPPESQPKKTDPAEHSPHQSIKKHLPYTLHDLFFVNTIVSLYPSIIIPLIPLAIRLMLSLKLTPQKGEEVGFRAEKPISF